MTNSCQGRFNGSKISPKKHTHDNGRALVACGPGVVEKSFCGYKAALPDRAVFF